MGNKHYINVLLSVEGPIDANELTLIRNDLESEISCCWHFFDIEDVRLVSPSMQVLTLRDLITLTEDHNAAD